MENPVFLGDILVLNDLNVQFYLPFCTLRCTFSLCEKGGAMITRMPISEARKNINSFVSDLSAEDTISVTNRGREVLAIIPWETYESISETLDILSDEVLMKDFYKGLQEHDLYYL